MVWPRLAIAASVPALLAVHATAGEPAFELPALWVETGVVPPAVRDAMVNETADILRPVGVNVHWRVGPPETESSLEELRVVPLPPARRRRGSGRILGATSTGEGPRTIWIDYANVAWVAGTSAESLVSAGFRERRRVGVAMGRVVAHEVIHAFVPELPHAGTGVMAEHLRGPLEGPSLWTPARGELCSPPARGRGPSPAKSPPPRADAPSARPLEHEPVERVQQLLAVRVRPGHVAPGADPLLGEVGQRPVLAVREVPELDRPARVEATSTTTTMPALPPVWRTARWGMTKDEVLPAFPGEAQRLAKPAARNNTGTSLRAEEIVWKRPDQTITLGCAGVPSLGFRSVTLIYTPPS